MNYEQKYKNALERAQQAVDKGQVSQNFVDDIFPEHKESEEEKNEKIRIGLIKAFNTVGTWRWGGLNVPDILAWLEKQDKTLDADKVIAWLVANICDFEYYVKLFKKDFGLC